MFAQIAKKQHWKARPSCDFVTPRNIPAGLRCIPITPDSSPIGSGEAAYRTFQRAFSHVRQSNHPKPNMKRKNRLKDEVPRCLETQALLGNTSPIFRLHPPMNSRLISNPTNQTGIRQRIAAVFKRDVFHLWTGSHLVITFPSCPQLAEHQPTVSTSVATALASSLYQAARRPATLFT
jgi:hypothetical protein